MELFCWKNNYTLIFKTATDSNIYIYAKNYLFSYLKRGTFYIILATVLSCCCEVVYWLVCFSVFRGYLELSHVSYRVFRKSHCAQVVCRFDFIWVFHQHIDISGSSLWAYYLHEICMTVSNVKCLKAGRLLYVWI